MSTTQLIITIIFILNILCVISVVCVERKRPQSTIAWILVMNFLPIIGVFIYIFLGNTVIPTLSRRVKRHFKKYDYYMNIFEHYLELNKVEILESKDPLIEKYKDTILLNTTNNNSVFSQDNEIKLYTNAKEKYNDLFNDIENAEKSINIEYFIIRNDSTGKKLIELLSKKASQGVTVNLLYDELGSFGTSRKTFAPLEKAGGHVCRFFGSFLSNLIRANNRNHRKIAVIDGKIGYTGGMNIGDEYMGYKKLSPWRDTHIRIEGSSVYSLQVRFLLDFISSYQKFFKDIENDEYDIYFPEEKFHGNKNIQIVTSGPDSHKEEIKYSYLKIINSAKKNIYIQTPYFVPDEAILEALKLASCSGVKVKLMLPAKPDKMYVYHISMSYAEELMEAGVEVYLYNGFIHSKTIVADSEIYSVGTANFDVRSFSINYEINAIIYDSEFSLLNETVYEEDIRNSTLITYSDFKERSKIRKIKERIFRLFSPLA